MYDDGDPDLDDFSAQFFESMFAGQFSSGGFGSFQKQDPKPPPSRKRKADPQKVDLNCSLEDLYSGATKKFALKRKICCKSCRGSA